MSNTTPQFDLLTEPKASEVDSYFKYCNCGPRNIPDNISEPADVFLLFWGPIWEQIIDSINLEIAQNIHPSGKACREQIKVTSDILLAWLGCWIELGLHPQHSLREAFSKAEGNPFVKNYFYRDEFHAIFGAMWHLKEKVFELIETHLNKVFPKYWTAFRETSIDEGMALFKGHWHNKVYSPDKPIRFGLKYYLLVDAAQYLLQFKLYRKETKTSMEELIYKFVDVLPTDNGQYAVYGDNYYGGLDLAKGLDKRGFKFTFTCRSNRPADLFKDFLHQKMESDELLGEVAFAVSSDGRIGACSWQDKSLVNFLSNIHYNDTVEVERRKKGKKIKTVIPRVAQDYTQIGMGHVDAFDSYVVRYKAAHKNTSWKRAHFLQLIQYSMVNCYHIYRMIKKKNNLPYKEFLKLARDSLVKRHKNNLDKIQQEKKELRREKNRIAQQKRRSRVIVRDKIAAALGLVNLHNK